MRLLPCGASAVLLEAQDAALGVAAAVELLDLPGLVDIVPAAETVLVRFSEPMRLEAARGRLEAVRPVPVASLATSEVRVAVTYDGPDLAEVAELTGLTRGEVVARHTGHAWQVAFLGFAPGFAYLTGGDPALRVPRRPSPRPRVPAGSVALADAWSALYPGPSPGGWQLIGTSTLNLWDPDRDPPATLRPGTTVRFVQART